MAKAKINVQSAKTSPRAAVSKAEAAASRAETRPANGKRAQKDVNQLIAERAFLLFERRGCAHGYHEQDWVEAEKQIRRELKNS